MRPIAVDLFAGAGGLSLGFEQAGFDVVAAAEIDPVHCAVHKFNFPLTAVIPISVTDLTGDDIRKISGIGNQKVDCVFGGPPCQGFSLIGQRTLEDPRNNLVKDFVRLVRELDAKTFVLENVKGLTVGTHKQFLAELVEEFQSIGYQVRLQWKVLNAANYGVPQSRERLILLGAKDSVALPDYPSKTSNNAAARNKIADLPDGPTCSQALDDLPNADLFPTLNDSDAVSGALLGQPSAYASELRCLTNDAWHFGYVRKWNPQILTSSARTKHSEISKRRFNETVPGSVEPISRFYRLPPNGVSNTLRAGTDGSRGAFTSPRPIHYNFPRCVTVREMARLHGFPDWFRFHATKWHGARQIGNSVPPPMARAIAASVLDALNITPSAPKEVISLGDKKLLTLEMSKAAEHFGVEALNSRRDRKSGAKKRKQSEIEEARLLELALNG